MKKSALFIAMFLTYLSTNGQVNQKIVPGSPEAASLAKFINFPVSLNTGIPNINIPIFTVKAGDIELPISLNYHAGGIKVNEKSTWVGLGWSLSAEPEITRVVNGKSDFGGGGYLGTTSKSGDPSYVRTLSYLKAMVNGSIEEEPDEFFYRLADQSGKFYFHKYLNNTYKAMPIPYNLLDIRYNQNSTPFQITDERGVLYRFGKNFANQDALEYNMSDELFDITSWKCTEMISPSKKDTVSFTYGSLVEKLDYAIHEKYVIYDNEHAVGSTTFADRRMYTVMKHGIYNSMANNGSLAYHAFKTPDQYGADSIAYYPQNYHNEVDNALIGMVSKSIKVNEIRFRGGKVQFFKHTNTNMLDSIRIYDSNNELKKSIVFHLSFWETSPSVGTADDRTRLDSISIKGNNSATVERYKFTYNSSYGIPMGMKRADVRGYHNKNINFVSRTSDYESAVPAQVVDIISPPQLFIPYPSELATPPLGYFTDTTMVYIPIGSTNVVEGDYTQAFMLKKIYQPTGGHTEFVYEPNRTYDYIKEEEKEASGLRIKEIKTFTDDVNPAISTKSYKYGIGENGLGLTTGIEDVETFNMEQTVFYPPHNIDISSNEVMSQRKRTYNARSFSNLIFADGSPVLYKEVAEYDEFFKKISKFDYELEYFATNTANLPLSLPRTEWPLGTLISETTYALGNSVDWLKKRDYTYQRFNKDERIFVGKAHAKALVMEDPSFPFPNFDADAFQDIMYITAELFVGRMLIDSEIEYTRNADDLTKEIVDKTFYKYDNANHIYATRIQTINSLGDTLITRNIYPLDFASSDAVYGSMATLNQHNIPIETVSSIKHPSSSTELITGGKITTFDANGNILSALKLETMTPIGSASFKFTNASTGNFPLQSTKEAYSADARYAIGSTIDSYDARGNTVQLTENETNVVSYKWGYKKLYPIAECRGAAADEFFFEDFEGNGNLGGNSSSAHTGRNAYNGTINLSSYFSSTYHSKSYYLAYFKHNGVKWEYFLTGYSGQTLTGQLDDIRIFPKGTLMSTYTYSLLDGVSSVTDPKGTTTYYEYDNFQRLKYVRDQDGNIIKSYCYNYAGDFVNCNGYTGEGIEEPVGLVETPTGYSALTIELCNMGEEGAPPHQFLPIYGIVELGTAQMIGQPTPVYYIDNPGTTLAPNGYYTKYEFDPLKGYLIYELQNGLLVASFWCYEI